MRCVNGRRTANTMVFPMKKNMTYSTYGIQGQDDFYETFYENREIIN